MAYCTYEDVRRLIHTSLDDTDLTALITLADHDVDLIDATLPALTKQLLSMLKTALLASLHDPSSRSVGEYSETLQGPEDYQREIDRVIREASDVPFRSFNEPFT